MTRVEWLLCCFSFFKSVLSVSGPETQGPIFITEPRATLEFLNEMGAVLSCSAHGLPDPTITWLMSDGSSVTPVLHLREIAQNGSLYFPPFGAENYRHDVHSASYQCLASNSVGQILSREVNVRAVVKQHYDVIVRDTYVLSGNAAVLKCEIPTFVKGHVSITSWVQDSSFNIYPSPYSDAKHHMLPSGELVVYSVTQEDSHSTYRCRTVHHITGKTVESSTHGRVIVTESKGAVPPRYHERVSVAPVREGETAVLSCTSQGFPPPQYFWYKSHMANAHLDPLVMTEKKHIREGVLIIQNVGLSDNGRYVCVVNNSAGSERIEVQLTVLIPISIHLTPQRVTVDLGRDTILTCSVTGHPRPTITWRKDGLPVRNTSHRLRIVTEKDSRLEISRVTREDKGMYQCFAKNDYDMSQGTTELSLGDSSPQLVYRFIEQTMQPGPSVSLKCIAAGNPTPHFTWTLDGFPLPHNDRLVIGQYVTVHGDVISHVNISSVNVEDGGEYRCTAKNRVDSVSHSARLNIYGLPLVRPMSTIAAVAGHDLVLQCPVAGYPISAIVWEKDGQLLPINRRQEVSSNGTLVIRKVDNLSDGGAYMCLAKNKQGHHDSKTVQIDVKVPPKIENFSFPSDIQQGSRVLVTCVIGSGDLPLRLEWLFNGSTKLPDGVATYTHGEDDLSLRIASASPSHTGNYTCVARNQAAQVSHEAALIVHVPPRIAPFSFNKDLSEGVRVHLSCVIEKGDPPFTITWLKDREPLPSDGLKVVGFDTHSSTVIVDRLDASHTGNYTCRATNQVASVEYTAELIVSVPPRWSLPPDNHQAAQGAVKYSMDCQAEGNPPPTVTWRRGVGQRPGVYRDIQQDSDSDTKVFPNGSLVIERLEEEHEGYYLCEAFNGIGTGLSKRIYLTVNAAPQFALKHKNQTSKLGSSAVLKCEVKGDRPLKVLWRKAASTMDATSSDYRYSVKESNSTDGFVSELILFNTNRDDSGVYYCVAANNFGRDEMTFQLFVQEPPDCPRNVHVLEKGSRFVKLGWVFSQDGNSPILQGIAEYKVESDLWQEQSTQVTIPVSQTTVMIGSLRPAVTYQFRLFAENELGRSQPSSILEVMTESEVPSGVPRNVQVTAVSSTELNVVWDAPEHELWNGEILGYHVGYKEQRLKDEQYQYKNIESKSDSGGEILLVDLKKFTKYSIVVQAYNALGPGPTSSEVLALTLEDVPSASPQDVRCVAFTSQSVQVSWSSVPDSMLHGHLKGYKVLWENTEDFDTSEKPITKITTALNVVLHGLDKFTNYSIQVLAFTNAGDGVPSSPIYCLTDEDVPEVPRAIKAVVSNPTSIVISWLPPDRSNGVLTSYNLHIRSIGGPYEKEGKGKRHSVPPDHTSYEEEGLNKRGQYEFTVAAATKVGEGARTLPVTLSPTPEVRAAVYSFGTVTVQPWKSDVKLSCKSVGKPQPSLVWKQWSQPVPLSSRYKILGDGTLQIVNLVRSDSGNYSCHVQNQYGSDSIVHQLQVQVPPSAPLLHAKSATSSTLNVQWKQGDNGGAPIRGYYLYYKKESSDWETIKIGRQEMSYVISDLHCGTPYQIYILAYNSIGKGDKSETITAATEGSKPVSISKETFLIPNTTSVALFLENWLFGNSCPITHLELSYRRIDETNWTLVSGSLLKQKYFLVKNLQPGTEYVVLVKANNNAGSVESEYKFFTLQKTEGVSPSLTRHGEQSEIPFYLDLRIVLPFFTTCLAILCLVLGMYYWWNKRESVTLAESNCSRSALKTNENVHHRGEFYATVKKPLRSPVRDVSSLERIPEYAEDIYPYATFQLNQVSAPETRCTSGAPLDRKNSDLEKMDRERDRGSTIPSFLYHDSMLTAAETLKIKESTCGKSGSRSKYRGVRRKAKSFKSERDDYECDSLESETDAEISDFIYHGPDAGNLVESSRPYDRTSFPRRGKSKLLQTNRYSFESGRVDGLEGIPPRPGSSIPFGSSSSYVFKLEPPTGFSDSIELSEAECDRPSKLSAYRSPRQSNLSRDFTIAV